MEACVVVDGEVTKAYLSAALPAGRLVGCGARGILAGLFRGMDSISFEALRHSLKPRRRVATHKWSKNILGSWLYELKVDGLRTHNWYTKLRV